MKTFEGKVAAITGAGSGIGRQLAIALAKKGAHLALSDVNASRLAETADLARAAWDASRKRKGAGKGKWRLCGLRGGRFGGGSIEPSGDGGIGGGSTEPSGDGGVGGRSTEPSAIVGASTGPSGDGGVGDVSTEPSGDGGAGGGVTKPSGDGGIGGIPHLAPAILITTDEVDVSNREAVAAWADKVVADHGKVNLIFNNAGVALGSTVEGVSYEDFEWLFGINFWGVVYGTKAFLPHLKKSGDGHIVNTSSVFGLAGLPAQSAYCASKFAVRGFTESLRQELDLGRFGVSATTVHPGAVRTDIARSARSDESMARLGLDAASAADKFEASRATDPEEAARQILTAVRRDRRRLLIGPDAVAIDLLVRAAPKLYQRLVVRYIKRSMGM